MTAVTIQSRMVDIGQGRAQVEFWEAGEGVPLVFLHGAGGLMPNDRFFQALARKFHVYAPLLPGYGNSEGEDELKEMPVENTPKEKEEAKDVEKEATKKMFPFMLRVTYPKVLIIKEK